MKNWREKFLKIKNKKIFTKINETIIWLESNQNVEKEIYESKQKDIEGMCLPIFQNLSGGGMSGSGGPSNTPSADDGGPKIEEID